MKCRKTETTGSSSRYSVFGDKLKLGLQRQRGVALVLTLIMLAVITVITVIFLATARRNRASTTVRIDQTTAEIAAETAYQHATGKIIERILNDRDLLSFDFFVSRPLGGYGFITNNGIAHPAERDAIPIVLNDSNTVGTFFDLNRTRYFDDPGNPNNRPYGDPIWLGILDRPWFPHSKTNRFLGRMAYLVQPVGKVLDLNTIHHDTAPAGSNPSFGYMRNQGFGPWELNFAAFLHEFNPGFWDYSYTSVSGRPNTAGRAFEDALSIVRYREGWPANALSVPVSQSFSQVYLDAALNNFPASSVDVYSDGNLGYPVGLDISVPDDDTKNKTARWPGADTTNHFFHVQELFDRADVGGSNGRSNKVTYGFYEGLSNTLAADGTAYYRMLAQLGTDTGSDVESRINLNFADQHARIPNSSYSATNFVTWNSTPALAVAFFTNVAQRIFLTQSNDFNALGSNQLALRSILEIPVYPTNRYSSAVHRILQEAANIYAATSTNPYPPVFRPVFGSGALPGVVYVTGYVLDGRVNSLNAWFAANTNNIPAVVGAKKGLPNFNEFTLRTTFLTTRKVQVERDSPPAVGVLPSKTNLMYILGISNSFWAESWNSYVAQYPRPVTVEVHDFATTILYNDLGYQYTNTFAFGRTNIITPGSWRGRGDTNSFRLTLNQSHEFLTNSVYRFAGNFFTNVAANAYERSPGFPVPYWILNMSNRVEYRMYDGTNLLDVVLLSDAYDVNLNQELYSRSPYEGLGVNSTPLLEIWNTNRTYGNGPFDGLNWQFAISLGDISAILPDNEWSDFSVTVGDKQLAMEKFKAWCGLSSTANLGSNYTTPMQAPFNPAAKIAVTHSWQANDPLVHYHPEDLRVGLFPTNTHRYKPKAPVTTYDPGTIGQRNTPYSPWGGDIQNRDEEAYNGNLYNPWLRDPGAYSSDDWSFPSGPLATVGLLGRVHRGTPWQTIYFKSSVTNPATWALERPTFLTHPSNDWKLPDMFTTSLDERTSRGLMSINQTNMESWSATLSGVLVLSNNVAEPIRPEKDIIRPLNYTERFIAPWGGTDPRTNGFAQIWQAIHRFQTDTNLGRPLRSVGEFLQSVPELTTKSPFLDLSTDEHLKHGVDDFAYEQIPQQILSLLRVGQSRFVVYAYGQALKPESIDPASGAVRNYQVTAEFATRTVLRVEGDPRRRVRVVVESFNILPPD